MEQIVLKLFVIVHGQVDNKYVLKEPENNGTL